LLGYLKRVNIKRQKETASHRGKTMVIESEDSDGKYERYVIRRQLPAAHQHS